jgi:spermidine/putrescine transport system permease protein
MSRGRGSKARFTAANVALTCMTLAIFAYLYLPIAVVILLSFNDSELAALPLQGVTLRWYSRIFHNQQLMSGLWNSLTVALAVVAATVPLGLMLAYAMREARGRLASALVAIVTMPMQAPRIILAVLLLILFGFIGMRPSLLTVFLGHVVLTLPFAALIIAARLQGIDRSLEEAAYDLGASRRRIWLEVLLPLLWPAVAAAALIAFTISFDEMVVSYFTIGTESTLPIVIWSMVSYSYTQEINAIGTVIIAATLVLIALAQFLQHSRVAGTANHRTI